MDIAMVLLCWAGGYGLLHALRDWLDWGILPFVAVIVAFGFPFYYLTEKVRWEWERADAFRSQLGVRLRQEASSPGDTTA